MKKVIVAIDFGTSGTTYAFAFMDAKEDIILAKWNIPDIKNSTEIILNNNNEIKKFGNECKKYFLEQSSLKEELYHFTDIKMKLYDNVTEIKASNNNIKLDIELVIEKILVYIKEKAIKEIQARRPNIEPSEILWKLTVPAIWRNKSKEIMINASKKAGIIDETIGDEELLFLALEPEAAACDFVNENISDQNAISPGNKYIVCDIGGGTVDISTHKRVNNSGQIYIEEIYPPIGGNHGSTYINKSFLEKVIKGIFGQEALDELTEKINDPKKYEIIYEDYCELLEDIEEFKKNRTIGCENEAKRINCSLFKDLIKNENSISTLIKNYNNNCPLGWEIKRNQEFRIYFPYQIMIDLTKEIIVNNVVKHLKKILKNVPNIKSIIYAGSVSSNECIISMIKNELNEINSNLNHYLSAYPSTAVVKGALIFGFYPYLIKKRISKYTIGISVKEKWNEKKHGNRQDLKYYDKIEKSFYCNGIFSPIIYKDKKIDINEKIEQHYIITSDTSIVKFYKTNYSNVKFIDEKILSKKKCVLLGKTIFDVGENYDENNKDVVVELQLGGTYVFGKIIYGIINKIEKPVEFDFSIEE